MARRKYSDVEKAEAIAAVKSNGGNIFRTSQELKIPWATLADWVKGTHGITHGVTQLREEKEQALADLCESVARKYLNHAFDDYVVHAVPGNLAMTAAGIAIDKSQLLRGRPTEITSDAPFKSHLAIEIESLAEEKGKSQAEIELGLQERFSNESRKSYDPGLDPRKHPELWPSGNMLSVKEIEAVGEM